MTCRARHLMPWLLCALIMSGAHASGSDIGKAPISTQELVKEVQDAQEAWRTGDSARQKQAMQVLQDAAGNGVALAQSTLGWIYGRNTDSAADRAVALRWLEAAAAQGDGYALVLLSSLLGDEAWPEYDAKRSGELLFRAAELRQPGAVARLARTHLQHDRQSPEAVRTRALLDAEIGLQNVGVMLFVGLGYLEGELFERDARRAFSLIEQAGESNYLPARLWMAQCLARGLGAPVDSSRSEAIFEWMRDHAGVSNLNNFAWSLAVSRSQWLRDGERAVRIMDELLQHPENRRAMYLDTLAAAYAEVGRFSDAANTQQAAIELAGTSELARNPSYLQRLALYRSGKPYRE